MNFVKGKIRMTRQEVANWNRTADINKKRGEASYAARIKGKKRCKYCLSFYSKNKIGRHMWACSVNPKNVKYNRRPYIRGRPRIDMTPKRRLK